MDFYLDSANLEAIRECLNYYPLAGVCCHAAMLRTEEIDDINEHIRSILATIGNRRKLHFQVTALQAEEILKEAIHLNESFGSGLVVRVPADREGIRAIRMISKAGILVEATAVFSTMQGYLAAEAGADYIGPYVNHMVNAEINAADTIQALRRFIDHDAYELNILASSFKNIAQINSACAAGADAVSITPSLFEKSLANLGTEVVVKQNRSNWVESFGDKLLFDFDDGTLAELP